ncbi:MAG: alpha/beta hydrolase [Pseudolysinimonas sp.]|uniref:alpha/beta fold hydrolase n=1 Tax=Pseudolysinimonas sp. TaxID=2680009 RepID=UPI0032672689
MPERRTVTTTVGPVEFVDLPGEKPPVLFFPGGHSSAAVDCGWEPYRRLGHRVIAFSRPGYGATRVGHLDPAQFADLIAEVCAQLGVSTIAAAVGVSFGGMQAVHVATHPSLAVERLALHSCAPSALSYPDTRAERILGPIVFSPLLQGVVWGLVHRMVRSESGLKRMLAPLSRIPIDEWWGDLTADDRDEARDLFLSMSSDAGFANDLRHSGPDGADARRAAIISVTCPTLVTASRDEGGVSFAHSEEFAALIPNATLVELGSPTHLGWIGPGRPKLDAAVEEFFG